MAGMNKILLVDDDTDILGIYTILLASHGYNLVSAQNGQEALDLLNGDINSFAMVITDVSMPVMDGYALCENIKSNDEMKDIPVIFVSANTGLDEIMKGYAKGGFDYVTKPIQENVIVEKINHIFNSHVELKELSLKLNESNAITKDAITFSSELGLVIEFYKTIMQTSSYEAIASSLFEVNNALHLSSSLQIYSPNKVYNFSSQGKVLPLELNVMELSRNKGRLYEFGKKMIVNYRSFSLLIKNMPIDDEEKCGHIRDILAMLGNGLEAKVEQLNNDLLLQKREEIIKSIHASLENIDGSFNELQKENIDAIEDLGDELNDSLLVMGLMEYQEEMLNNIAKRCLTRTNNAFYKGISIKQSLENIQDQLALVINRP